MVTRRERVVLEIEDRFTPGIARASGETELLARHLDRLDKNAIRTQRSLDGVGHESVVMGRSTKQAGSDIDRLSGRMRILADVAAMLGPSLVPIGAVAVPAISGLASQLGFATVAAGTALAAFQGVGDALKAVNEAQLEPTAENLEEARQAMRRLSPAAQDLVMHLNGMIPELRRLRNTAAAGLFPGLEAGLGHLERALPRVERILAAVSTEMGEIAGDTGASLASDRWAPFLDFLAEEAPSALSDMASAIGDVTHGLSEMWMAFTPLNRDFSSWLVDVAERFDRWATGLAQTQGFTDFVDYIRTNGPQVGETLGAIGGALLEIVEAAAPLGGPTLKVLEAIADVVSAIADSDLGTPLLTMLALTSALSRMKALQASAFGTKVKDQFKGYTGGLLNVVSAQDRARLSAQELQRQQRRTWANFGKGAGLVAGLGLAYSGVADKLGVANTASMALMGTIAGPWGAAIGGGVGVLMDMQKQATRTSEAIRNAKFAFEQSGSDLEAQLAVIQAERESLQQFADENTGGLLNGAKLAVHTISPFGDSAFEEVGRRKEALEELEKQYQDNVLAQNSVDAARRRSMTTAAEAAQREQFLAQSTQDAKKAARDQARAWLEFGDSLDDAEVSLNGWIKSLEEQAEALSNFTSNAQKAARRGLRQGLIAALEEAGPAGAMRMKQLANATDAEIARANAAWDRGRKAIRDYNNMKVPPKTIQIKVNSKQAVAEMHRLRGMQIPNKTFHVTAVYGSTGATYDSRPAIGGGRFASGGWTGPGSKFQPAGVVHADEFVFSKEATHGNVAYLESLHRTLRGYAGGGMVQPAAPTVSVAAPNVNVGGSQVAVFLDGQQLDARIDERLAAHTSLGDERVRAGANRY